MYLQNEGVSRHETLQLFLFLFPLQHMKRPALQNKQVVLLRMAFRDRKVLGTFEKQGHGPRGSKSASGYGPGDPNPLGHWHHRDQDSNPRSWPFSLLLLKAALKHDDDHIYSFVEIMLFVFPKYYLCFQKLPETSSDDFFGLKGMPILTI